MQAVERERAAGLMAVRTLLAAAQSANSALSDQSFESLQRETQKHYAQLVELVMPWAPKERVRTVEDERAELARMWRELFGDPKNFAEQQQAKEGEDAAAD